ncbi:MAG: flagellar filament capping protein FliD, partial [Gammaproteobacteria bacterium]|nr:flagellar filament capping protein FliD [Gammaproteobacteria bacterium]
STDGSGQNLEVAASAKNALFSIDGITVSNSFNEIKDTIPGVTLNLKNLTDDGFESFKIEKEISGVKQSIQTFVSNYNELMTTVETLTGYDAETGKAGPLSGDASIRGVVGQLRRYLSTSFNEINKHLTSLSSIGIDSERNGTLSVDETKLDRALNEHADEIAHLFSAAVSTTDPKIRVASEKVPDVNGVFNITINQTPENGGFSGVPVIDYPFSIIDVPETIRLKVDNISTGEIKILPRTFESGKEFAAELQRVINMDAALKQANASVTVNYINNAIKINSNSVGLNSVVNINSIGATLSALSGLYAGEGKQGSDLTANVNGYDLVGEGTKLKLDGSLSGVVLDVSGNTTGERGEVIVTNGIASILNNLVDGFLSDNGLVDARIDGYNAKIKDIEKQRETLVRKLAVSEERYLKQFSNLDAMLGKMRSTSNFLAEKLSNLPGAAKN